MKKVIKPASKEEAVYYSDFSGKPMGEYGSDIEVNISCGYGSQYDGADFTFNLNDEDITKLLKFMSENLSTDFKDSVKKTLNKYDKNYGDAMQMRDWSHCDNILNNSSFLKELLK